MCNLSIQGSEMNWTNKIDNDTETWKYDNESFSLFLFFLSLYIPENMGIDGCIIYQFKAVNEERF